MKITDTKLYVPDVTWSTKDNEKLLEQSKSGFKGRIYWKKYQSKVSTAAWNPYLDYLIDLSQIDQSVKNNLITYDNIQKIALGQ